MISHFNWRWSFKQPNHVAMELHGLKSLLKRLAGAEIESIIVGEIASMAHGSSLTTRNFEILYKISEENSRKLIKALKGSHPVHRLTTERLSLSFQDCTNLGRETLYLSTDLGQLDCLGEVAGIGDFYAVRARSEELDLGDFKIRILSLETLTESKKAIGRPRDIHAVHELEAILELRKLNRPSS
jgi:hypothetical protein